jgi:tRNA(adenine34) deaminase
MEHAFFMKKALDQASDALQAGEFPVGCVMVLNDKIVAMGRRTKSIRAKRNELDHAEMIALRRLVSKYPGQNRPPIVAYSTLEPCLMCYSALIVNGIKKVVYAYEDVYGGATGLILSNLTPFYRGLAVEIVPAVLREESLSLLKIFFSNPQNDYLRGTPLAEHALGRQAVNGQQ